MIFNKILIFFFSFLFSQVVFACECEALQTISLEECGRYDVIFEGTIDTLFTCAENQGKAVFTINNLYKGKFLSTVEVNYECGTSCDFYFAKGATWIIYGDLNNAQEVSAQFCSHTRRMPTAQEQDVYAVTSGLTFLEENNLLQSLFGKASNKNGVLQPRRYEKVNPVLIPVFLGVSLAVVLLGLWLFKKYGK